MALKITNVDTDAGRFEKKQLTPSPLALNAHKAIWLPKEKS